MTKLLPLTECIGTPVEIDCEALKLKCGIPITVQRYSSTHIDMYINDPKTGRENWYCMPKGARGRCLSLSEIEKIVVDTKVLVNSLKSAGCSVGSDPEVFVVDDKENIIPAFEFLGEKKDVNPYHDGFQAEFTTGTRSQADNKHCVAYLTDELHWGIESVAIAAKKYNKNAKLSWKSVIDIPMEVMREAGPNVELGCMPSLNAYSDVKPIKIDDPSLLPIRFAGCHLHFGLDDSSKKVIPQIVKSLDAIIGVMHTSMLEGMEDPRRRIYYGRAGEYRTPPWGLEYRTPSSGILAHPILFHITMDLARIALYAGASAIGHNVLWKSREDDVRQAIDQYDVNMARKILKSNLKTLRYIIARKYSSIFYDIQRNIPILPMVEKIIMEGAQSILPVSSMEDNWRVDMGWTRHSASPNCSVAYWRNH